MIGLNPLLNVLQKFTGQRSGIQQLYVLCSVTVRVTKHIKVTVALKANFSNLSQTALKRTIGKIKFLVFNRIAIMNRVLPKSTRFLEVGGAMLILVLFRHAE